MWNPPHPCAAAAVSHYEIRFRTGICGLRKQPSRKIFNINAKSTDFIAGDLEEDAEYNFNMEVNSSTFSWIIPRTMAHTQAAGELNFNSFSLQSVLHAVETLPWPQVIVHQASVSLFLTYV